MRKIIPFLIVGILFLSGIGAVAGNIDDYESEYIKIDFSTPNIKEEKEYVKINIEETNSFLMKHNQPMIPKYTHTFIYPFGTEIKDINCNALNIKEKQLSKKVMTTPKAVTAGKIISADSNENVESSVYPEDWYKYDVYTGLNGKIRSVFVNVQIYPIKYHEQENKIEWAEEVELEIDYVEPESTTYDEDYNLVIITENDYESYLNELVVHKEGRGITTKLVTLNDIYFSTYFPVQGIDEQEEIKYFIKNCIENWGTSNIMLVGRDIPRRDTHVEANEDDREIFVSDLYYADIYDGRGNFASWDTNYNGLYAEKSWGTTDDQLDLHPDVNLGRLACNNADEVETVVDKIIDYETQEAYAQNWFNDLVTAGGDSFPGDDNEVLEGEIVNEAVINVMDGFIPNRVWVSEGDLTTKSTLNNAINDGAGFIDFSGHGNTNVWATHPHMVGGSVWLPGGGYFSANVKSLSNRDELPIVITGACSVGKYNKDENCFSWSWLSNENGGGIASFGATGLGWAYIGEYVTYGLIEKMTIEMFEAYKQGAISVGEMWTRAINSYIQSPGLEEETDYKTVLEWQSFSDPTLAIGGDSQEPEKPSAPEGPTAGDIYEEYTYTTSTSDPEFDDIYYLFDWGDGTTSGWVGPYYSGEQISVSNTWTTEGDFLVRVKAKDIHGVQSDWSDELSISMPRNKAIQHPILVKILNRFTNMFPILDLILGI